MDLGTVFTIIVNGTPLAISGNFLLGLFFVFIAAHFRRVALSGRGDWKKANDVVQPSLQASPPPIIVTRIGIAGILSCWASWGLISIFAALALDQFLANGALILVHLPDVLVAIFSAIGHFVRLFLRLASALIV